MNTPTVSTMGEMWTTFAAQVLPVGCNAVQRVEMRRAFYAGAWSMFCIVSTEVPVLDEVPAMAALDSLRRECIAFRECVERGLA
jgi:hypothetical protein